MRSIRDCFGRSFRSCPKALVLVGFQGCNEDPFFRPSRHQPSQNRSSPGILSRIRRGACQVGYSSFILLPEPLWAAAVSDLEILDSSP